MKRTKNSTKKKKKKTNKKKAKTKKKKHPPTQHPPHVINPTSTPSEGMDTAPALRGRSFQEKQREKEQRRVVLASTMRAANQRAP